MRRRTIVMIRNQTVSETQHQVEGKGKQKAMNIEELLSKRIYMPDIKKLVSWACESEENVFRLWHLMHSKDRTTSVNALWTMTHLPETNAECLASLRNGMIDMLLEETDTSKKRLLLQLLRNQAYGSDEIRTDFLDYCLSKINSECEPYAVRCFSIYAAYKMCRHFPELIAELEEHLDMMQYQNLSPGLKSALRQTKSKISKLKK